MNTNMITEQLFEIDEVAKALRVHRRTVLRWVMAGKVKAIELPGGKYRITAAEFDRITQGQVLIREEA